MTETAQEAQVAGSPSATIEAPPPIDMVPVARAQRILIASMAIILVAVVLPYAIGRPSWLGRAEALLNLASVIMAVYGAFQMGRALKEGMTLTLVWCAAIVGFLFIDGILSIIVIAILSAKATKAMRKAGLKVGFLGAKT